MRQLTKSICTLTRTSDCFKCALNRSQLAATKRHDPASLVAVHFFVISWHRLLSWQRSFCLSSGRISFLYVKALNWEGDRARWVMVKGEPEEIESCHEF